MTRDIDLLFKPECMILKRKEDAKMTRPLSDIAWEITRNWHKVNFAAKPYLQAMFELNSVRDNYGYDSGDSIVRYFLSNATSWRGDVARRIKAELREML